MSDNIPCYPDGQLEFPFSTGSGDDIEFFYIDPDSDEGRQLIARGIQLPPLSAYYMVNMFPTPLHGPVGTTQRLILSPTPSTPEEDATPPPHKGLSQNVVNTVHTGDEESVQGDSDNAKLGGPVATHVQKTKGKEKTESPTSRANWTSSDLVLLARTVGEGSPDLVSRGDEGKSWATVRDKVMVDETFLMRDTSERLSADEFRLKANAFVSYYKVC